MPPIIRQQVQPAAMQAAMQSQQHWIILQQSASPEVQVMQQPSVVNSHLHMPIVMLQQHTIMPFIMQQHETIPPAIILQRFCIMAQAAASLQTQVIFMPPAHFSIFILQRGTITMLGAMPLGIGIPMPMLGLLVFVFAEVIGFIIAVTIVSLPWLAGVEAGCLNEADDKPRSPRCNRDPAGGCFTNRVFKVFGTIAINLEAVDASDQ
ncbi:MAG: hypothetical protein U0792_14545 [Gemmataceae bacterium]